jgi:hypothetical protein
VKRQKETLQIALLHNEAADENFLDYGVGAAGLEIDYGREKQ